MKARPILMSAPMICSLLDGRKSQTRRIIKPQPEIDGGWEGPPEWALFWKVNGDGLLPEELARLCPYGKPGDLLWCRETFFSDDDNPTIYKADGDEALYIKSYDLLCAHLPWKPSIHMPRWASRLTLEITEVRVQRLQEITEEDAKAEGLKWHSLYKEWGGVEDHPASRPDCPQWRWYEKPADAYRGLWESINGPGSWAANPWVWALTFRVHQQNVDAFLAGKGEV